MSAPALQPLAANDARPMRPVVYQTRSSANAAAMRMAANKSPSARYELVEWVSGLGCYRPVEGGVAFEVGFDGIGGDFMVTTLSVAEVAVSQQRGIRAAIAEHVAEAAEWETQASASRIGSVQVEYRRLATEARELARSLELKLTASVARAG